MVCITNSISQAMLSYLLREPLCSSAFSQKAISEHAIIYPIPITNKSFHNDNIRHTHFTSVFQDQFTNLNQGS